MRVGCALSRPTWHYHATRLGLHQEQEIAIFCSASHKPRSLVTTLALNSPRRLYSVYLSASLIEDAKKSFSLVLTTLCRFVVQVVGCGGLKHTLVYKAGSRVSIGCLSLPRPCLQK